MSSWHSSRRDSQRVLELQSSDSEDEKFAGQISLDAFSLRRSRVYRRRWLVLLLFCLASASAYASSARALSSPSSAAGRAAAEAYGVEVGAAEVATVEPAAAALLAVGAAAAIMKKGMRTVMLLSAALLMLSSASRIRFGSRYADAASFSAGARAAEALAAAGSVALKVAPPVLAHAWFPPAERILATSLGMGSSVLGLGLSHFSSLSYLSEEDKAAAASGSSSDPSEDADKAASATDEDDLASSFLSDADDDHLNATLGEAVEALSARRRLETLSVFHYVCSLSALIACMIYFPSAPDHPPDAECKQDALAKKGVVSSLSVLCRDPWSWAVSLCYALPSSSALVFQEVIFAEREALGAGSADECRTLLAASALTAFASSAFLSFLLDRSRSRITFSLLSSLSAASHAWLALAALGAIGGSDNGVAMRAAVISGSAAAFSSAPLAFEVACCRSADVHQGLTSAMLVTSHSLLVLLWWGLRAAAAAAAGAGAMAVAAAAAAMAAAVAMLFVSE